jgi:hypothetical protein
VEKGKEQVKSIKTTLNKIVLNAFFCGKRENVKYESKISFQTFLWFKFLVAFHLQFKVKTF